jgi:hypothetical protein
MDSDFMIDLELVGVVKKSIALNCSSFDAFVKELNPAVVLFDRFMMEEHLAGESVKTVLMLCDY